MNNRCKELAEQAGYLPDMFGITHWDMPECRKFAQLIVRECGVALSPMLRDMVSRGQAFDLIKQHFGVEETRSQKMRDAGFTRRPKGWTKDKE